MTEPRGEHAMVLAELAVASSLVCDFHEGWGFRSRESGGSLGSSVTVFGASEASRALLLRAAEAAVEELNAGIDDSSKRWVVAERDATTRRGGAFSNFCHEVGTDYVLVETSGQGDIQPLPLRVAQARLILLHLLRAMEMIA